MLLMYGIVALISLCMVGICIAADKKRDAWLILVFVSVSFCNLGYFILSISKDLGSALNANRISYLGSVFLPFFLLMMANSSGNERPFTTICFIASPALSVIVALSVVSAATGVYSTIRLVSN